MTEFEGLLFAILLALPIGVLGIQTCSDNQAMSKAREDAPLVGVVEDVNMVSDGGLIGGDPDTYLQIDDEIYKYISEDPVPAKGSVVKYRVVDDRVIDVEKIDVGDEDARDGGVSVEGEDDQEAHTDERPRGPFAQGDAGAADFTL